MKRKRGKNNRWQFPTKKKIREYRIQEEYFWMQAEKESWGKLDYYSEEKLNKEGLINKKQVVAYIVVSKERAENTLGIQACKLKQSLKTEEKEGFIGKGLYLYENRRYTLELARKENKIVLGCLVELRDCLDLMQNKGQIEINKKYKQAKLEKKKISDSKLIDEICKDKQLKSVRSVQMIGNSLYVGSKIYKYMSGVICVKDIEVIKKWYKLDLSK